MKRQGIVTVAVVVVVAAAVLLFATRREKTPAGEPGLEGRAFVDDSLGVRLRLPDAPGWSLRREPPGPDGRIVSAVHEQGTATVTLVLQPIAGDADLDGVFRRRQEQIARFFGVSDLQKVIARVHKDEKQEINGRLYRQWQAMTHPVEVPGERPSSVVLMWLQTLQSGRSAECLGMMRFPTDASPEEQAASDVLLRDIAYILQSFEVR